MLLNFYKSGQIEAGCDEAGRGCLAGPVVAAAVILPADYGNKVLNDSKLLSKQQREDLETEIKNKAIAWSIGIVDSPTIDEINILNASILAMHRAIETLSIIPEFLLIDGNKFNPYPSIPHKCFVKGDGRFLSIAAASVLAKTHRDKLMNELHHKHPEYGWNENMGYPTRQHKDALIEFGITPYHRKSFNLNEQLRIDL